VGAILGFGLGGYIAAESGWRGVLLMAGAPGLLLAALVRWGLAEPRSYLRDPKFYRPAPEGLGKTLAVLGAKSSFLWALVGTSVYLIFAYGASVFFPSFMVRLLNATLSEVGFTWGIAVATADALGGLSGGWLADRLAARDIRWYAWLPSIACLLSLPLYCLAISAHTVRAFIALHFVAELVISMGYPVFFVAIQAVCGYGRRTMASAVAQGAGILFGSGLGPVMAGGLSDLFGPKYGADSLRYALFMMTVFLIPAAIAFYRAAQALPHEIEL
jgi:MFS family permease